MHAQDSPDEITWELNLTPSCESHTVHACLRLHGPFSSYNLFSFSVNNIRPRQVNYRQSRFPAVRVRQNLSLRPRTSHKLQDHPIFVKLPNSTVVLPQPTSYSNIATPAIRAMPAHIVTNSATASGNDGDPLRILGMTATQETYMNPPAVAANSSFSMPTKLVARRPTAVPRKAAVAVANCAPIACHLLRRDGRQRERKEFNVV